MTEPEPQSRPVLRIVGGGQPSDEEVAALVVALSTLASTGDVERPTSSRWAARGRAGSSWARGGWLTSARHCALRPR